MFANEIKINQFLLHYCRMLTADIADGRMTEQPMPGVNHPAWIVGHLAFSAELIVCRLGGDKFLPGEWAELFKPGSSPRCPRRLSEQGSVVEGAGGLVRVCPRHRCRRFHGDLGRRHAESSDERGPADASRERGLHPHRALGGPLGPAFLLAANDRAAAAVLNSLKAYNGGGDCGIVLAALVFSYVTAYYWRSNHVSLPHVVLRLVNTYRRRFHGCCRGKGQSQTRADRSYRRRPRRTRFSSARRIRGRDQRRWSEISLGIPGRCPRQR